MVLSFQCTTTESAQHILKHIDDLKHYIQEQRELIDDSLRLVVWENKLDELCSVIFYAPVKVSTKIDPYFILKNGLTMIGVSELIYIEEIKFSLDTSKRSETNIVYHVDSPEDIGNFESEKFAEQYLRDPVNINLTGLDDEYVELFDEELKRIKAYDKDHFTGLPCHYLFTSDSRASLRASEYLVWSLVEARRLPSNRIRHIELTFGKIWYKFQYSLRDTIMRCLGHAVRIVFTEDFMREPEHTRRLIYQRLIEIVEEYGNSVQFIIHFTETMYRESRVFLDYDRSNLYIEFSKQELSLAETKKYIVETSFKYGIDPFVAMEGLIDLSTNKTYTIQEIKHQFVTIKNNKLNQPHFEPYRILLHDKHLHLNDEPEVVAQSEPSLNKLEKLIGLESVKNHIKQIVKISKIKQILNSRDISIESSSKHCCFLGHPGTAKTTVARLMAQIMKEEGILKTGYFVEVTRKDLIGEYVGQTAPKVKEAFNKARGGVLFIDEAYALRDGYSNKSFGDEAIATLVELMENHRHDTIVIMAGYPKEMHDFLEVNPGLKSRIPHMIQFNNYSVSEMAEIAKHVAMQKGFSFEAESLTILKHLIEAEIKKPSFANGRTVRNMVESIIQSHVIRLYEESDEPTKEKLVVIATESVELHQKNKEDKVSSVNYS